MAEKKIGNEAVKNATGMDWQQWFRLLDRGNAKNMNHKEIVSFISQKFKVSPWWQQMLAVNYEQQKGLRKKYQKPAGYEISVSKKKID